MIARHGLDQRRNISHAHFDDHSLHRSNPIPCGSLKFSKVEQGRVARALKDFEVAGAHPLFFEGRGF
jgi:hypothetical protein